ncbi:MAG: oxidoreductase FAD/NAD(P)-binding domain protein [Proteobacteria bacterium]|nr:oxidoreductase FAD/NAD(P)-binding domain protein [Pseudomonadota bacterium]
MNKPIELPAIWLGETPLVCIARTEETHDCATFELAAPTGQRFDYFPGQFVSVGAEIDGKTHWRAYSISSSPNQPETLAITVKRVEGGLVSNWLLDHWRAGMSLPALAPAGDFGLKKGEALPPAVAFFSAGSGITPMVSMSRWLLGNEAEVEIHFFHSARSESDFIFGRELLALAADYPQFRLHLFLTQPQGGMPCHTGRLDAARVKALLPDVSGLRAWLCGQDGYMDAVSEFLSAAGVADECILRESFTPPVTEIDMDAARYALSVPAFGKTAEIAAGESLLDVMEREGLPIIGACRTGVCGSCKCKVLSGIVESASNIPLTADEVANGYVLACSSTAKGDLEVALG